MLSSVHLSVCLSVRPSVTRVDQSKTVEIRITPPSPKRSPMISLGTRVCAFDWYQSHRPWMTLNCCKFKLSRNFAHITFNFFKLIFSKFFRWYMALTQQDSLHYFCFAIYSIRKSLKGNKHPTAELNVVIFVLPRQTVPFFLIFWFQAQCCLSVHD